MIVVDTSVWIDNLRSMDTPAVRWLRSNAGERRDLLIGDVILLEILQGTRSEEHAKEIDRDLRAYGIVPMMSPEIARLAARHRQLRALGITVRKTMDLIIATFCIAGDHHLLHGDRDFSHFEHYLGLRVVRP
jgi:predicted nucleic acid-binding protein